MFFRAMKWNKCKILQIPDTSKTNTLMKIIGKFHNIYCVSLNEFSMLNILWINDDFDKLNDSGVQDISNVI